jgi:hypothetical protein
MKTQADSGDKLLDVEYFRRENNTHLSTASLLNHLGVTYGSSLVSVHCRFAFHFL